MVRWTRGRRICDRFTLLEELSASGATAIWRARDEHDGRDVALKILPGSRTEDDPAWRAFEREHSLASRLEHPGILRVQPPLRCGAATVLPMELAARGDLSRLRGESYLRIVPLLIEVAQALGYAHGCGVVHRDLKPANVLLDEQGRARLADFGAAALDVAAGADAALATPLQKGSPFSASPQQLDGETPSPADDIYGLGALAYELLSGYPPHYPHLEARLEPAGAPKLVPAQQVPPRLAVLIERMLAADPAQRPGSMRTVIEELHSSLYDTLGLDEKTEIIAARPPPSPEAVPPLNAGPRQGSPARSDWDDLSAEVRGLRGTRHAPSLMRIEPMQARRWPWVALVVLLVIAGVVFFWLPQIAAPPLAAGPVMPEASAAPGVAREAAAAAGQAAQRAAAEAAKVLASQLDAAGRRLQALEARAAAIWGGEAFARARAVLGEGGAADRGAAADPGEPADEAARRLAAAKQALDAVEARAAAALEEQLQAGRRALAAGQSAVARQAFETALRIDPVNRQASGGLERAKRLDQVLALVARAENARSAGDAAGAAQLYEEALALDAANERARTGLAAARAAASDDAYARALGEGFAALVAGRYPAAREAFTHAKSLRPASPEADEGLARVAAASESRSYGDDRERIAQLESEERWGEALAAYERILATDPSIEFARAGRVRAAPRAELGERLQRLIDRPERLAAPEVRAEADRLLASARAARPAGPVIRSQISRLEILLPDFDKPVRLAVESDNATQVSIQRVGTFGAFRRREIELPPGKYTMVGTRDGYRDVRRDITVAPGQGIQTVTISCVERI